jgi:hypothetical protein
MVAYLSKGRVYALELQPHAPGAPLCRAMPETLDRIRDLADGREFTVAGLTVARSGELYHVMPEGEPKRGKAYPTPNQAAIRVKTLLDRAFASERN